MKKLELGAAGNMDTWADFTKGVMETFNSKDKNEDVWYAETKAKIETAEFAQHIVKHLHHGKNLNVDNLIDEAGDVFYYLALIQELDADGFYTGYRIPNRELFDICSSAQLRYALFTDDDVRAKVEELLFKNKETFDVLVGIVSILFWAKGKKSSDYSMMSDIALLRDICIANKAKLMRRHGTAYNKDFYKGGGES